MAENQTTRKHIARLLLLAACATSHAAAVHEQGIEVYSDDMRTLLARGSATTSVEQGLTLYRSTVQTPDGQPLIQQEIRYETATLKTVYSHQVVATAKGQFQVELQLEDGIYRYRLIDPEGKETLKSMPYAPGSYMDITLLRRVEQLIPQLRAGDKVPVDIMVPGMERNFTFVFSLEGQQTIAGKPYGRIVMQAQNWLIARMAPEVVYLLDNDTSSIVGTIAPWGFNQAVKQGITLYR